MLNRLILTTIVFSLLLAACAKIVVVPITAGGELKEKGAGIFYALPQTVIRTEVGVQKTTYSKGQYAQFASIFAPGGRLLCKDAADCKAKTRFWLKEATLSSYGRPDPDHVYLVKFAGSGAVDQSLSMTWNEVGLPATVSASVTNRTTDFVLSGVKLAGGVYQRAGGLGGLVLTKDGQLSCIESLSGGAIGLTTDKSEYALGVKTVNLAKGGVGALRTGDSFTFRGDLQIYKVSNDVPDVSTGGPISFDPGLMVDIEQANIPLFINSGDEWVINSIKEEMKTNSNALTSNYCNLKIDTDGTGKVQTNGATVTGTDTKFSTFFQAGDTILVTPSGGTCSRNPAQSCKIDGDCQAGICKLSKTQARDVLSITSGTSLTVVSAFSPPIPSGATFARVGGGPRDRFDRSRDENALRSALVAYKERVIPLLEGRSNILGTKDVFLPNAGAFLDRINTMLSTEMSKLFLGSKKTKTAWKGTLDVIPATGTTTYDLLHINPAKGICLIAPLAPTSKLIPSDMKLSKADCTKANQIQLGVDYHPAKASQLFDIVSSGTVQPSGEKSFRYRIPAQVRAQVIDAAAIVHPELIPGQKTASAEVYGSALASIAQMGYVAALPARRNSKKLSYDLAFIEATGGLRSFKLGSTGVLDASILDSLGTTATGIMDARKAAKDAAAANADELAMLQRRAAILKAQHEICAAREAFGLPCDIQPEDGS